MKDFDVNLMPSLDDESEENFDKVNALIDMMYEKANKEKKRDKKHSAE